MFQKKNAAAAPQKGSPEYMLQQYNSARSSILTAIILTVVNVLLTVFDAGYYLLFSIAVPYYGVAFGMGMDYALGSGNHTLTAVIIGLVITAVYFLLWLMSKKRRGVMLVVLVLFILDTVALVLIGVTMTGITAILLDLVFHVLILVYLIQAARFGGKLTVLDQQQAQYSVPAPEQYYSSPEIGERPSQYHNGPEL